MSTRLRLLSAASTGFAARKIAASLTTLLLFAGVTSLTALPAAEWRFAVQYPAAVHKAAYTGRVYIFFSRVRREPRRDPDWFHPEEFIAKDVTAWKPGEPLEFTSSDPKLLAYPGPLATLDLAGSQAQSVIRFNPFERTLGSGPGNGYSQIVSLDSSGPTSDRPLFIVDQLVPQRKFPETAWRKEFIVRSKLLSEFFGRDVTLSAAVVLPTSYESDKTRRYPTLFVVPGFSGTHYPSRFEPEFPELTHNGVDFIRVVLDPSCPLGHHVFADSANNGPVGQALVTEFLPALDRAFRTVADPRARYLTGHSSGGWSTLWLQITYPDHFGGTWSTSPDSVDFRDFQRADLYRRGENLYFDPSGEPRPLARIGGRVMLAFPSFARMEDVLGYGGQLHSFEAVFSPRDRDGQPQRLWDRKTGAIDSRVAHTWEKYDIRLVLERNWKSLGPKLIHKLHVYMGDEDTFYLDGATRLLKESLIKLGSDAVVEIRPGKNHFTLLSVGLTEQIRDEMADTFRKKFPANQSVH
jgi:hypothetical protein